MESTESARIGILEVFELLFQKDVFLGDVSVHKCDFGFVRWVVEDGADELVHWCYAGAASDEADVFMLVGGIWVFGYGSFQVEELTWDHVV